MRPARRPANHDQAFEWSNDLAGEALMAAVNAHDSDQVEAAVMTVMALAFRAGYYAGLADPLPEEAS